MCDEREPLLAFLYDEADAVERQRVEAHLATCERCREELAGLRSVRSDLLAWDVPEHESVWKPFTPARPAWSWSDVPAWSLAAAALVMLTLGAAGGLGASAWLAGRAPVGAPAPAPLVAAVKPTTAATQPVTAADLAALEQRIRDLASRPRTATPVSAGLMSTEYDNLLQISLDEHKGLQRATVRMNDLQSRVNELKATVDAMVQNQQGGGR